MTREAAPALIRVRNWHEGYENNRSREMKNTHWFPMPNDLSADSYVELLDHQDGPAYLGVWTALLMVASRARPRGPLVRDDGRPHNADSLARMMRLPAPLVERALERLISLINGGQAEFLPRRTHNDPSLWREEIST